MRRIWPLVVAGLLAGVCLFAMSLLRVLPPIAHDAAEFGIEPYVSPTDADGDGLDDASDMLASTRAYLDTKPAYASAYYQGGYPDDGRGVCTDVVAQAMLGAGYDLRELVDEDVRSHPDAYDIPSPDANIDFRRVRNLRVFFDRNAASLTCDTSSIEEWQAGDIVCWGEHIGIVSDKRNAQGRPLVLHHGSPLQLRYEEDVIDNALWGPIVGHWRWR